MPKTISFQNQTLSEAVRLLKEGVSVDASEASTTQLVRWLEELHAARTAIYEVRMAIAGAKS